MADEPERQLQSTSDVNQIADDNPRLRPVIEASLRRVQKKRGLERGHNRSRAEMHGRESELRDKIAAVDRETGFKRSK